MPEIGEGKTNVLFELRAPGPLCLSAILTREISNSLAISSYASGSDRFGREAMHLSSGSKKTSYIRPSHEFTVPKSN